MIFSEGKKRCNCAIDMHHWIIDALCDSSQALKQKDWEALHKNLEEMETGFTRITKCIGHEPKDIGFGVELEIYKDLLRQKDRDERWVKRLNEQLRTIQDNYFRLITVECGAGEPRPTPGGYIG